MNHLASILKPHNYHYLLGENTVVIFVSPVESEAAIVSSAHLHFHFYLIYFFIKIRTFSN